MLRAAVRSKPARKVGNVLWTCIYFATDFCTDGNSSWMATWQLAKCRLNKHASNAYRLSGKEGVPKVISRKFNRPHFRDKKSDKMTRQNGPCSPVSASVAPILSGKRPPVNFRNSADQAAQPYTCKLKQINQLSIAKDWQRPRTAESGTSVLETSTPPLTVFNET